MFETACALYHIELLCDTNKSSIRRSCKASGRNGIVVKLNKSAVKKKDPTVNYANYIDHRERSSFISRNSEGSDSTIVRSLSTVYVFEFSRKRSSLVTD